jgi:hypothetical protein
MRHAAVAALALLALGAGLARAQTPPSSPPTTSSSSSGSDEDFTIRDSSVGYIDSAIPANVVRLRYDSAYHMTRPNRAEFFYGPGSPIGPGLEDPERNIDYQEISAYLEVLFGPRLSFFGEVPVRFLNPEVNDNAAGLSDVNAGFKYAFLRGDGEVATFQLRGIAPTGDVNTGLGTSHASVEPALLYYRRLDDRLILEGELRVWVPIGGSELAGDVLRYGLGLSYDLCRTEHMTFRPVVEFVGWTVLSGKETVTTPAGDLVLKDAAGDDILNVKLGMRTFLGDRLDFYAGYGRALTGTRWYEDIIRVELRWSF